MTTAFISGHLDVDELDFAEFYKPLIDAAIARGDYFVVGDAKGADMLAQNYLYRNYHQHYVRVYHMFEKPRWNEGSFATVGGFTSDEERDAAMTAASDYDIAWIRPGKENSGTARNLKRRLKQANQEYGSSPYGS